MKLWILKQDFNEYDQPDNNLAAIWTKKPTIQDILLALELPIDLTQLDQENLIASVSILKGDQVRLGNADYQLKQVEEGKL